MRFIVSFPLDPPCCLPLSSSPPSSSSIRERNENKVESKLELRHRRVGDKVSLMGIELEPLLEGHVHHERLVNLERVLRELPLDLRVNRMMEYCERKSDPTIAAIQAVPHQSSSRISV